MQLEKMDEFFSKRVGMYDGHMLNSVSGCKEGYSEMARLLPKGTKRLLDLGCGTGLELEQIFRANPKIEVTGIDYTQAMLDELRKKYSDKNITLYCASFFDTDFGAEAYDTVISFQAMHHFSHAEKVGLYERIKDALKPGGKYIECDYMVLEQAEEDAFFAESGRIRKEQGIAANALYHFDTPCTIENQIMLLQKAGFSSAEKVWRRENTTIVVATK